MGDGSIQKKDIPYILYTIYTMYHIYYIPYILYTTYTIYNTYYIPYILYTIYTIYHIYYIPYILYTIYNTILIIGISKFRTFSSNLGSGTLDSTTINTGNSEDRYSVMFIVTPNKIEEGDV
jgi:hypothetical protein